MQNFDILAYVGQWLAPYFRTPRGLAYVRHLLAPLISLRLRWVGQLYPLTDRRARYTAQIPVFERALTVELGSPITITDGVDLPATFIFADSEWSTTPTNLRRFIFTEAEWSNAPIAANRLFTFADADFDAQPDFTVNYTSALAAADIPRLRAWVERIKIAGTNYRLRLI